MSRPRVTRALCALLVAMMLTSCTGGDSVADRRSGPVPVDETSSDATPRAGPTGPAVFCGIELGSNTTPAGTTPALSLDLVLPGDAAQPRPLLILIGREPLRPAGPSR